MPQLPRRRISDLILFIIVLGLLVSPVFGLEGNLTMDVNIVNPISGPVKTGQMVEYVIDFSCSSIVDDCGFLDINFQMDSEFNFTTIEVVAPPGYTGVANPTGLVEIDSVGEFADGEAAQVTVRARVGQDLDDLQLVGEITGEITEGVGEAPQKITVDGPPLTIEEPEGGWTVGKTKTNPPDPVGPIVDGQADFQVSACPTGTLGVAQLSPSPTDPLVIVDTIPDNATVDSLPLSGATTVAHNPGPPSTITWTFESLPSDPWTIENGCVTVDYTLGYPSSSFSINDAIPNSVIITAPVAPDNQPFSGVCGTDCMGTNGTNGIIDSPTVTAGGNKSGPGTSAIVAPGNSNGTSVFTMGWNLNLANVPTNDLIVTDIFPVALNTAGTPPIIEVTEITSGAWSGGYQAVIEYSTTVGGGAWQPIATTTGGSNTLYTEPTHFPADITGIRWHFTDTLPAGFNIATLPSLRFFVRSGLNPLDYDSGSGYHDYQNCLTFSGTYDDGGAQPINVPAPPACDILRIGEDTSYGFTNIQTSKSASPSAIFPTQNMTFTLTLDLTQEASGDLLNPAIEDILPFGMQIISWDSVTFNNFVAGDPTLPDDLPYLKIEPISGPAITHPATGLTTHPVTGQPIQLQRLLFYWDDAAPGADTYSCASFPCTIDTDISTFALDGNTASSASGSNPFSLTPPLFGVPKTVTIQFTAQARLDTPATNTDGSIGPVVEYGNTTAIVTDSFNLVCQTGTQSNEAPEIDGDGVPGEVTCETDSEYEIREAATMSSEKWIRSLVIPDLTVPEPFRDSNNLDNLSPSGCPIALFDVDGDWNTVGDGINEEYTRFPCVARGQPGQPFEYLMRVRNTGLVDTDEYLMYDILPHIGDVGVSQATNGQARGTEFHTYLTGPIEIEALPGSIVAGDFTIEYYTGTPTYNPARPEMSNSADEAINWSSGGTTGWTTIPVWADVTAFRIILDPDVAIPVGAEMVFSAPMVIDGTPGEAESGEIAWNNFAQRFTNAMSDSRLLTAEPRKVGIVVEQKYSLGNRVWIDDGIGGGTANDGRINGTEIGINGVTVELYQNTGSGFALYATDVTRSGIDPGPDNTMGTVDDIPGDGYYFFGDLDGGPAIQYYVYIPGYEFNGNDPDGPDDVLGNADDPSLANYISSTGRVSANNNNENDNRDTGIDQTVTTTTDNYIVNGVRTTNGITLTGNEEPTGETDHNMDGLSPDGNPPTNEGPFGRGENYEEDQDSDLTVDFGFFKPMSIGNRVWYDSNTDGLIDGADDNPAAPGNPGIDSVYVELWRDNGNGVFDDTADTLVNTVQTANGGYYLFDLLTPDEYFVRIRPDNFNFDTNPANDGPLARLITTTPTVGADNQADDDDNGIDPPTEGDQRTDGVVSPLIVLQPNLENATETDKDGTLTDPDGLRTNVENSELTVDFGFYEESISFSLGNIVWDDLNNDGIYDADGLDNTPGTPDDETGLDGVELALYLDADANGIPDTPGVPVTANVFTAGGGYYLFDNLDPGRYVVHMVPDNWTTGVLGEYASSTGDTATEDTDSNDNGEDPIDGDSDGDGLVDSPLDGNLVNEYTTAGIYSNTVRLVPQGEPSPINAPDDDETGSGSGSANDNNSDLTVDFGVYRPLSIGNRVWLDDGSGGAVPAERNDGIMNGTEAGIPSVIVNLYYAADLSTVIATDITDADGYYLFSNLLPDDYVVEIPFTGNFGSGQPLQYHENSIPPTPVDENVVANNDDQTDHGVYADDMAVTAPGVRSATITLAHDSEPTTDTDISSDSLDGPDSRGNHGEADDNSDLTVDFGFYIPPLSLGNRVWYDNNNNGILDGTDDNPDVAGTSPGIGGVTVNLIEDTDADGTPDTFRESTITDADGYYLFDNLPPGAYHVELPGTNWVGVLNSFISSTDQAGLGTDNQQDTNTDENGTDPVDGNTNNSVADEYLADGVISTIITLLPRSEPLDAGAGGSEVDRSPDTTTYGPNSDGTTGEDDDGTDLTIDFGFFEPLSIGNRVWMDSDNNQIQDPGEAGVNGVLVNLYQASAPAVVYRSTVTVQDSVTLEDGYYIFDGLPEGDYIVEIAARNFQNLPNDADPTNGVEGILYNATAGGPYFSSEDTDLTQLSTTSGVDQNDNGIDDNFPATNGIRSNTINLELNTEPDGANDADLNSDVGEGTFGELDENAEMTIDFGFYVPAMSLGNRVFYDYDNNRQLDGVDVGVENVRVSLFMTDGAGNVIDQDGDGGSFGDPGDVIATDLTNADGYYIFDGLQPGFYIVVVHENNFRTGGILQDYYSSQDSDSGGSPIPPTDDDDDVIEDGIDSNTPEVGGVRSPVIELSAGNETVVDTDKDPVDLDGEPNIQDTNSNLTVDFGFYKPMSIGNIVWFDTDADGLISGSETGIAGVTVNLYRDDNNNGLFDPGAGDDVVQVYVPGFGLESATEQTDANGYYLFDNLTPGNYFVQIDPANWDPGGALAGISSTTTNVSNPPIEDSNDNGTPDATNTPPQGVYSELVILAIDTEPQNEVDLSLNLTRDGGGSIGRFNETDSNSNLTIDFGFLTPNMSLGNRVWLDTDKSGVLDGSETGIEHVSVSLYRDINGDGAPDGAAIATDITDNTGHYLFENLTPGGYVVGIDLANFNSGNPLFSLVSTFTGVDNLADVPPGPFVTPDDEDSNDNGLDMVDSTYGILSDTVTLIRGGERNDEIDLGTDGNGTGVNADDSDLTIDFGFYQPMSVGNRVWFDLNNNGQIDAGELGVPGVTVTLYADTNENGIPEPGAGDNPAQTFIPGTGYVDITDVTDTNGYYLFDGLPPGDYFVLVATDNFAASQVLENTVSSNPHEYATLVDNNDNGLDDPDPLTVGVPSNVFILTLNSTPVGEVDLSNNPDDDATNSYRGNNGETDNNADLTIDFGFVPTAFYSLGNRVWLDNGGSTGTANDGIINGDEIGLGGVSVSLYRDTNADGQPDGASIANDTTDTNGYYLFDGLPAGDYIVAVNASNFQSGVLVGYASTLSGIANPPIDDSNDNRMSPATGTYDLTLGIYSGTIALGDLPEPVGEVDLSLNPDDGDTNGYRGNNNETDDHSDLTIDFGFIQSMSLGNRVWFDFNNNGLIDAGENGIAGVNVELFQDTNGNNTFDPGVDDVVTLATDTTDSNGYYMFNGLLPGTYFVRVAPGNFTSAQVLEEFTSSTGVSAAPDSADRNDNGVDPTDYLTEGVVSEAIVMIQNATPTGETDVSGQIEDGPNFRGANNETDNNSNMTVDFGFFATPMSIGNQVWFDTDGNGILDGTETGISGVLLELFADVDGNGVPDGAAIATDVTDSEGYYLFDGLPPGQYIVGISPLNFNSGGSLYGLNSTTTTANNPLDTPSGTFVDPDDDDANDNGIDNPNPETDGILSNTIDLTNPERMGETVSGNPADGPDGWGNNGETDDNSDLTIDFGFTQVYDWGDAPDTYGTNATANDSTSGADAVGPSHRIIPQLQLGVENDDETSGQPSVSSDGDDTGSALDDEDGVTIPALVAGTTINLEVEVLNNTGSDAAFVGWFDWDDSGTFEPGEAVTAIIPSSPATQIIQVPVTVPLTADTDTDGDTFARFRLTTDTTIDDTAPTGPATDGEVEDYYITVFPPGLSIVKTDGSTVVIAGQATTYTVTISNSGVNRSTVRFTDTIPTSSPDGFDPATVSWTCTANANASCDSAQPLGTGSSGTTASISEWITLNRGGIITYEITATLYSEATAGTIINIAELPDEGINDSDVNDVVFDTPSGVKEGEATDDTTIRWTHTWVNSGGIQSATITDVLPDDQAFAGDLICTALGTSVTTSCIYNTGIITWTGTIETGYSNRVLIAFDVMVPGDGTYQNTATLNTGITEIPASGTIAIGGPLPPSPATEEPSLISSDPAISKAGSPMLAQPGEIVTWTIVVTNPGQISYYNVEVSDSVAPQFEIINASATAGIITTDEQDITLQLDVLPAGETVIITIVTRMRGDPLPAPFFPDQGMHAACTPDGPDVVGNMACIEIDGNATACAHTQVFCAPGELPATGETSWWRDTTQVVLKVLVMALSIISVRMIPEYALSRYMQKNH